MSSSVPTTDSTRFDVREIPCRIKHGQIFQRWFDLPVGGHFVLVNDHDPVPLYYQFAAQFPGAFNWEYQLRGPEEFQVRITKLAPVNRPDEPTPACPGSHDDEHETAAAGDVVEVDARGLEPPEPLMRILAAMETLTAGRKLRAITDREPCHLFGEAKQRGFRHESSAQPNGSWVTVLERA
ncbi:DUF2249 domain-containing protein [Opitutus sp. ER46]|uniref:DUF2249 domain-containing protein n=1 Tax=Opitutus sp. ER46 TaxID=2161864 RepID=UPI000D2F7C7C|nr:DUF2249 domain-containing protein [Opitutus sp. ER46]PTX98661.1 hypothetical protein DB354_05110 [Opitutus sp. ER46]